MKRLLGLLLASTLVLGACGSNDGDKKEESKRTETKIENKGIKEATDVTSYAYQKQNISPNLLKVYNGIGSFTTNLDKQAKFVFYDTQLKQNFVFIAQKDELIKQNNKIIEQNDEIIQLLKKLQIPDIR